MSGESHIVAMVQEMKIAVDIEVICKVLGFNDIVYDRCEFDLDLIKGLFRR